MSTGTSTAAQQKEFAFNDQDFQFLGQLVYARVGIVLAEHKRDMVYSRLARRLRALGLRNFADYCALLQSPDGEEEMVDFVNAITTNLTSFFREQHHFTHLRDEVLAPLAAAKGKGRFRIWSSACSSGMEPYSLAMTVLDAMPDAYARNVRILATDIDTNMLRTGMNGEYAAAEYERIPQQYRAFATMTQGRMHMAPALQELISFRHLNLLEAWPMQGLFDVVFCRNVVIYFDKPTQKKLFSRIADQMPPGGWLYIGHSENLMNVSDRFEPVGRTIYRRLP